MARASLRIALVCLGAYWLAVAKADGPAMPGWDTPTSPAGASPARSTAPVPSRSAVVDSYFDEPAAPGQSAPPSSQYGSQSGGSSRAGSNINSGGPAAPNSRLAPPPSQPGPSSR